MKSASLCLALVLVLFSSSIIFAQPFGDEEGEGGGEYGDESRSLGGRGHDFDFGFGHGHGFGHGGGRGHGEEEEEEEEVRIGQAIGFLDVANLDTIAGWTCIPRQPESVLFAAIIIDNQEVAVVRADVLREQAVGDQCGGNRNHGFSYSVPRNIRRLLSNGQSHTIQAFAQRNRLSERRRELEQSPRVFTLPNLPPIGFLDEATTTTVVGWACDPNAFSE